MSHAQTKYNVQLSLVLIQQLGLQNRIANVHPTNITALRQAQFRLFHCSNLTGNRIYFKAPGPEHLGEKLRLLQQPQTSGHTNPRYIHPPGKCNRIFDSAP